MSDRETLDERLRAVERTLTDGERNLGDLAAAADQAARLEELVERLDEIEARVTDLESASQALRGYVGNVRAVNRDVERRADAALAKVERLERDSPDGLEEESDRTTGVRTGDSQSPEQPFDDGDDVRRETARESADRLDCDTHHEKRREDEWDDRAVDGTDERQTGSEHSSGDEKAVRSDESGESQESILSGLRESL